MTDNIVTCDFSQFGAREIQIAQKLLEAYLRREDSYLGSGITLNFNKESGYVFLSDSDYNVMMLNDKDELEAFISCSECGNEGFASEGFEPQCNLCHNCLIMHQEEDSHSLYSFQEGYGDD